MRRFEVDVKFIQKLLGKALHKRYGITLDQFLDAKANGVELTLYPGSEDLSELTKLL